ncbi:Puromycin-sensitive aminopeptidase [Frankliniella fusca]|uniref:Aminopeptidase n=1 Tax=Frankliniella fusca TaxID=407009 RepID=A0AAE1H4S9_9NEOP|nr:Puromycin-sensitive aminopeptidase [Frankliniella fusca]
MSKNSDRQYDKLPKSVIPTHYNLYLKPNLLTCTFEGKVTVTLKVNSPTDQVKFHSIELELSDVELRTGDGKLLSIQLSSCNYNESITLDVLGGLNVGLCTLSVKFKGVLDDNLRGFYQARYVSVDGEERVCAITQFEASKAHRCFPCWDEPAFKATFDITVCCPEDRVALSNMPISSEVADKLGSKEVRFATSPIMSTYLVAVVVGEFDFIEQLTPRGVKVRVYTPVQKKEQGQFALDTAIKVLPFFEDFFQIPFPLPKMDLIAVPSLSFGAMENWGLITYRESCLLADPKVSSVKKKQYIAIIVAHEIAHQWFGNLVTMEWWEHLWLNEGYATFMEFLSVAKLFPDYKIWNQFISLVYSPAMKMDALKTSHSVEVPVNHPLHVDEIFDDISYNKGASLIRMLHAYIGDNDFEKGMNMYLNKFKFRNASTDDLWSVLEEASHKPISSIMPNWTKLPGYPVVFVERTQDGNKCRLLLRQFKFCASGSEADSKPETWVVPMEYMVQTTQGNTIGRFELASQEDTLTIDGLNKQNWVKLNPSQNGFYRVQYSSEMLENLMPAISNLSLPPIDRLGILDDLFALVQGGYCRTDKILELLQSMTKEDSCMVWSTMSSVMMKLKKLLEYASDTIQSSFMTFGRKLLTDIKQKISWDPKNDEGHEDKLLRSVILDLLGEFEDETTIFEAEKRLKAHIGGSVEIAPDVRAVVYSIGVKNANEDLYKSVINMYHSASLQEERERIVYALASMKDQVLISKLMNFALSKHVRKENSLNVLSAISQTLSGREQVWNYTKRCWEEVLEGYAGTFALPHFISGVFSHAASSEMASNLEEFSKNHSVLGMERTIDQAIEKMRVNASWLERDMQLIKSLLENKNKNSSSP